MRNSRNLFPFFFNSFFVISSLFNILQSNGSLKFFYGEDKQLTYFINLSLSQKKLAKNHETNTWIQSDNGYLVCIYQINENNYHARSFEDAFFHINKEFFVDNIKKFSMGIKNSRYMNNEHKKYIDDVYFWAENCVEKKTALAMEILLNSEIDEHGNEFSNWNTPQYIKEGLEWLRDS